MHPKNSTTPEKAQLLKAADCVQDALEDLQCAQRIIRHLQHQLGMCNTITDENSELDSLVAIALEVSMGGGEWIRDVIARVTDEVEALRVATQNAESENVSRSSAEVPS